MSPLLVAVLTLAAPPSEGTENAAVPPVAAPVQKPDAATESQAAPRTGPQLRLAVRAALRRWARPSDAQADHAAREFLTLYKELEADDQLSRSQREYFATKVRIRLMRLSDQIAARLAREKRLAESRRPQTAERPDGKAGTSAQQQGTAGPSEGDYIPGLWASGPAYGGGAMQVPDHGQELVDLIQTVIRPETWDINGGPGSIYYWYPGRALVIRQTDEVHEEIGGVLDQLRRAGP